MPVGFNSAARNLFLLGSSGADLVTNFFKRIDQTSTPYNNYETKGIKYNTPDQKYILSGQRLDVSIFSYTGWIEKRSSSGSLDWNKAIGSTEPGGSISFGGVEIDSNYNIIACGMADGNIRVPYVRKYNNSGSLLWSVSSSNSGEYFDVAIDDSDNIYVCGSSSGPGVFVEKLTSSGSYLWGKTITNDLQDITLNKCAVNNKEEIICVGQIEDETKTKGYIVKIDTATGNILWDRTLENPKLASMGSYWQTQCNSVYIDNNDQIYVVGYFVDNIDAAAYSFIIKYSPEGNIIWQRETNPDNFVAYFDVRSDTETEQTVVLGLYYDIVNTNAYLLLSKYSRDGSLIWRRKLSSNYDPNVQNYSIALDADPSFYYLLFTDDSNQEGYVFGKVSTSGNGLGNFTYSDGIANVFYDTSNITDQIGRITDGSVRNDSSDLITYPFEANKLMFDDLATQIANKKVQLDGIGTYSSSSYTVTGGYPRISDDEIVYGNNLLLNYDFANKATYPGTGTTVNNLSSNSYPGTITGSPTFNSSGYFLFDGVDDHIINSSVSGLPTSNSDRSIELWVYPISTTHCFVQLGTGGGGNQVYIFQSYQIGALTYLFTDGINSDNNLTISGSQIPATNQWNHLIFQSSGQSWSYYKNGTLITSGSWSTTINTAGGKFIIGKRDDSPASTSNARYGEVRIYNKILTVQEISQNFNATRAKYGV